MLHSNAFIVHVIVIHHYHYLIIIVTNIVYGNTTWPDTLHGKV